MSTETELNTALKLIVFQLKDQEYAIEVEYVQSIERIQNVTRIPRTYPFVTGVMNLRGVITPVINLRKRFGIEEKEYDDATRILVVSKDDIEMGFIVDGANDVIDIQKDKIEPTPEVVGGVEATYLRGVVKIGSRLFTLLNLEKVITE
ncbi:chemotaxis protein CheW [Bacillus alkalicellulosilyticus]|uniref:chemotaxis protein CheW n=1 Tax=Alkalihalobacterium alkalicellulosilyticum TaxID=1912214 RepID=UPI000998763D|nr:chemotaxis protein CheW [Bacillus alkalicellulosilyticus]